LPELDNAQLTQAQLAPAGHIRPWQGDWADEVEREMPRTSNDVHSLVLKHDKEGFMTWF
jgi:hypothetical protein